MSLNKTVESRSRIFHIWFVCNCLYNVLVHEDFERLSFQHFAMNWFSLRESGAICAERNGHFDRNFGNYPHKSGFLKAPYMASHQKMMWELGLTYQDEDVEQVVLESVPPLYMIWLGIDPGLWSSQLLPGPEHLLSVGAIQQVLLHIALDHRGHDGLPLWVSLRLRAFNFPAPSLSSSLSYWSSSYSHSDDQHLHTRLKYPHLPKTQYIQTIPHPLLLVYTHFLTIDTPSPKKSAVLFCSPFSGTISGVVILKDK